MRKKYLGWGFLTAGMVLAVLILAALPGNTDFSLMTFLRRPASPAADMSLEETAALYLSQGYIDEAEKIYSELGDKSMLTECAYRRGERCLSGREYDRALEIFESLGDYKNSPELLARTTDGIYNAACERMYRCEFSEAAEVFARLGDYRNSLNNIETCRKRIELAENPPREHYLDNADKTRSYELRESGTGTIYYTEDGVYCVPDVCNEDTRFFVFYPGGGGWEYYLPEDKVESYIRESGPNALVLFMHHSGLMYHEWYNELTLSILLDISEQKGVVPHDVALCGASAGCYTALHGVTDYYRTAGIEVKRVVTLDTAEEWEDVNCLSSEEIALISMLGTELYLFEQPEVRLDHVQLRELYDGGCDMTIVECTQKIHNQIAFLAFEYGVFDFAMDYIGPERLKPGEYFFVPLTPETVGY